MNYDALKNLSYNELKKISLELGLKPEKSKDKLLERICKLFKEYEHYKKQKIDKYTKINCCIQIVISQF